MRIFMYILGIALISWVSIRTYQLNQEHFCRWPKCPYYGVKPADYKKAVAEYVGQVDTDAYYIDLLHLTYPIESYEQLEQRLFAQQ